MNLCQREGKSRFLPEPWPSRGMTKSKGDRLNLAASVRADDAGDLACGRFCRLGCL